MLLVKHRKIDGIGEVFERSILKSDPRDPTFRPGSWLEKFVGHFRYDWTSDERLKRFAYRI